MLGFLIAFLGAEAAGKFFFILGFIVILAGIVIHVAIVISIKGEDKTRGSRGEPTDQARD
jgi:hypothetical protein